MSLLNKIGLVALAGILCGCAGFRGGWESVPYVGEMPPKTSEAMTPYETRRLSEIPLPGFTLGVSINNRLRTYDTQVYLFVLPLSIDPRNVQTQPVEPGKTRITLRISDMKNELIFRPRQAKLTVGSLVVQGIGGSEFAMWDSEGREVSSGGRWDHRPTGDEAVLSPRERAYLMHIDFPIALPPPEARDISLDLSGALTSSAFPSIPLIRFVPVRWKEGYT